MLRVLTAENDILRAVAKPVSKFDLGLKRLIKDMQVTMLAHEGLGLAAPQVGKPIRAFVWIGNDSSIKHIVNPELEWTDGVLEVGIEGCLSIPGFSVALPRFKTIQVRGFDFNGMPVVELAEGLEARVMQHEMDHLEGILISDYTKNSTTLEV